jgi:hypothetical protein
MKKQITFEIKIPTKDGYKSIKEASDEEFELYRHKIAERVGKVLSRRSE